jgi:hypothetical protein
MKHTPGIVLVLLYPVKVEGIEMELIVTEFIQYP